MQLTNRDLKQLTPKLFKQPKAGYDLSHVAEEEERTMYCKCNLPDADWIKPCPSCGRRVRV